MILEVKNGSFGYKKNELIIKDINFTVKSGELLAILGPNGAGKTTLLRSLMGILKWNDGESSLDGVNIQKMSPKELWSKISYVPQAKSASSAFTALETVLLGRSTKIGIFNSPKKADIEFCEEIMESLNISHLKDKKCDSMSGGEFQMVLIAKALAAEPELLILDEPESNLDFKNQLIVLNTMSDLVFKKNLACIFNTHYPTHALQRASNALILNKGGSSKYGHAEDIITEDAIKEAFGVDAIIGEIEAPGKLIKNVIPLNLQEDEKSSFLSDNPKEDEETLASITIILSNNEISDKINDVLHDYSDMLIGRMGMPSKKYGLYIINISMIGKVSTINELSHKLNIIPGISVKTTFALI